MKYLSIILLAFLCLVSACSKSGKNNGQYGCYCTWKKTAGWHTEDTAFFYSQSLGRANAEKACSERDSWVKSMAGPNDGYCRLQ